MVFLRKMRTSRCCAETMCTQFDTKMRTVFLSHSSKDKPAVRRISRSLESHGISVWLDEAQINVGDSLFQKIADALESIDFVIAVISTASVTSKWVQKELQLAMTKEILSQQVTVLPLVIDSCRIPFFISDKCFADFRDPNNYDDSVDRLVKAILTDSDHSKSSTNSRDSATPCSVHNNPSIGNVVYPYTTELYAIRANEYQNRAAESYYYLGAMSMALAFFIRILSKGSGAGLCVMLGGCSTVLVGILTKLAFVKNKEAYARDPNILLAIENVKGWHLPFGNRWKAHYDAGKQCKPFKHGLIAATLAFFLMWLSILFYLPALVWAYRAIRDM